jgi:hypothetical protein
MKKLFPTALFITMFLCVSLSYAKEAEAKLTVAERQEIAKLHGLAEMGTDTLTETITTRTLNNKRYLLETDGKGSKIDGRPIYSRATRFQENELAAHPDNKPKLGLSRLNIKGKNYISVTAMHGVADGDNTKLMTLYNIYGSSSRG